MKMAAAEALYDTEQPASFSMFTIGSLDGRRSSSRVTHPLPAVASSPPAAPDGTVQGINDLQAQYQQTVRPGPGDAYYSAGGYTPIIPVTYWSFRLMIGLGLVVGGRSRRWSLWATRRGPAARPGALGWLWTGPSPLPLLPLGANSFGWIFTEMGRQPWSVFGLMTTATRGLARRSAPARRSPR